MAAMHPCNRACYSLRLTEGLLNGSNPGRIDHRDANPQRRRRRRARTTESTGRECPSGAIRFSEIYPLSSAGGPNFSLQSTKVGLYVFIRVARYEIDQFCRDDIGSTHFLAGGPGLGQNFSNVLKVCTRRIAIARQRRRFGMLFGKPKSRQQGQSGDNENGDKS